jgi:hypothetical protein
MKKNIIIISVFFLISVVALAQPKISNEYIKDKNKLYNYELSVSYPQIEYPVTAQEAGLNKLVQKVVFENLRFFRDDMKNWDSPGHDMPSYYEITYSVPYITQDVISIEFYGYKYYSGAAHPLTFFFSINFNLGSGKEITLDDIFTGKYLEALSDICIKDIEKQRNGEFSDNEWLKRGAGPDKENFRTFCITDDSLLITFQVYQVGPYVEGSKEVCIPYSAMKNYINYDGPLGFLRKK